VEFVLIIKYRQISINLPKKTVFGSFFIFILFLFFICFCGIMAFLSSFLSRIR